MTDKIEPCPYCGEACEVVRPADEKWRVRGMFGSVCTYRSGPGDTPAEAIAAHNAVARAVREDCHAQIGARAAIKDESPAYTRRCEELAASRADLARAADCAAVCDADDQHLAEVITRERDEARAQLAAAREALATIREKLDAYTAGQGSLGAVCRAVITAYAALDAARGAQV